jgi:hypothetical protein
MAGTTLSVLRDVKGRGMYIEALAEKVKSSGSVTGGGCDVAKVDVKMPEEFLLKLSRLGERDRRNHTKGTGGGR